MSDDGERCRLCGRRLADDPGDDADRLCGDCYWDDQTDASGDIANDDDED